MNSSYHLEPEGLTRGIKFLESQALVTNTFVSDRHVQIRKQVKENLPHSQHYFDIWHVAKGISFIIFIIFFIFHFFLSLIYVTCIVNNLQINISLQKLYSALSMQMKLTIDARTCYYLILHNQISQFFSRFFHNS